MNKSIAEKRIKKELDLLIKQGKTRLDSSDGIALCGFIASYKKFGGEKDYCKISQDKLRRTK